MPTDPNYEYVDKAHKSTTIDLSYRYGCWNRVRKTDVTTVQDGWKNIDVITKDGTEQTIQVPNFIEIPLTFKQDGCHHTERQADTYCNGCALQDQ